MRSSYKSFIHIPVSCLLFGFFMLVRATGFAQEQPIGEGIAKAKVIAGTTVFLYSGELIDDLLHHAVKKDSITFVKGAHHTEIGTAPAWFVPEWQKTDYDMLYLRVVSIARNWLEVIVNRYTGQTAWVERQALSYLNWPEFLLEVFSVELIPSKKNPLRLKPADHASVAADPGGRASLKPLAVRGDWIKVSLAGPPGTVPVLGWIRWKKGDQMWINWSPLS